METDNGGASNSGQNPIPDRGRRGFGRSHHHYGRGNRRGSFSSDVNPRRDVASHRPTFFRNDFRSSGFVHGEPAFSQSSWMYLEGGAGPQRSFGTNDTHNHYATARGSRYSHQNNVPKHFQPRQENSFRNGTGSYWRSSVPASNSNTYASGSRDVRYGGHNDEPYSTEEQPPVATQPRMQHMSGRNNRKPRNTDWSFYNPRGGSRRGNVGYDGPRRRGQTDRNFPRSQSRKVEGRSDLVDGYARSALTDDNGENKAAKGSDTRESETTSFHTKRKQLQKSKNTTNEDDTTQRERLTEDLFDGSYECMVCCERVRPDHAIWNCQNCYNIFHLGCIKKWARSSMLTDETGWRCPGCQNVTSKVPHSYYCFCGKLRDPEWNRYDTPHGCGEQCVKSRAPNTKCIHPCNLLCHPGPCPPCGTYVPRTCFCQKTSQQVRCGQANSNSCGETCNKMLNCGKHKCSDVCHLGECQPCDKRISQKCHCGLEVREVACDYDVDEDSGFSCGGVCNRSLECGNHVCGLPCHSGKCKTCERSAEAMTHCPCGKTPLSELLTGGQVRKECTDPIPTCSNVCGKLLSCGPEANRHQCPSTCHLGPCVPCALTSSVVCRCKYLNKKVRCVELTESRLLLCDKKCNVKKTCGRHKCLQTCCVDSVHVCNMVCGRRLKCGLHTCDEPCHQGNCPTCWRAGFDELTCHCGAAITYPPIPCGMKPPECNKTCTRRHPCEHPVRHNCHSGTQCPPCTFLMEKWCYGKHEIRTCIPCFQNEVCCGLPCNKLLPCGLHKCKLICHLGTCTKEGFICTQPCSKLRPQCGHVCGSHCHEGKCPMTTCKTPVNVKCKCGHRKATITCAENTKIYNRLVVPILAAKLHLAVGESVNLGEASSEAITDAILECNNGCLAIERNRKLALALQLRNPDLSNNVQCPVYSDFLKEQAKSNPVFVASIYDKLSELVMSAKKSKLKSRSHAFPPMKSDHRRVIHELAEHFGCETLSYDDEPKKNVAATAFRDKSWLPSMSIMAVLQKENGASRKAGKAPPPIPHYHTRSAQALDNASTSNSSVTVESEPSGQSSVATAKAPPEIDYFDYTN